MIKKIIYTGLSMMVMFFVIICTGVYSKAETTKFGPFAIDGVKGIVTLPPTESKALTNDESYIPQIIIISHNSRISINWDFAEWGLKPKDILEDSIQVTGTVFSKDSGDTSDIAYGAINVPELKNQGIAVRNIIETKLKDEIDEFNVSDNGTVFSLKIYEKGEGAEIFFIFEDQKTGHILNYQSYVSDGNPIGGEDVYRTYNPNTGEHLYTLSKIESNQLISINWKDEGIAWKAPKSGNPVYRLFNPGAGEHHYTLSENEKTELIKLGWNDEGIAWYSGGETAMYRLFNPNAVLGGHHYTMDLNEKNELIKLGWIDEGIGWYSL